IPLSIDFMVVSSYNKTESTGTVKIIKDLDTDLTGKDILIVEDILDTGRTLASLLQILKMRNPASLKICTFLDKPDRRVSQIEAEYIGKVIPDEFVVGYGLDYDEAYRNLSYVGIYDPED
ncbi:MAG: hypoxanthine phosphoribosyltransferase, partial [Clostridia bacterium]|nr:hypoxanthine phosphoribosyltransferase [Clostridia bacterium]